MASKKQLVDPSSPQASYGSSGLSSSSGTPTPTETPKPPSNQPDFDKIEVLSVKSDTQVAKSSATTSTSVTASTLVTTSASVEQSREESGDQSCWTASEPPECDLTPLNGAVCVFSLVVLIIRCIFYRFGDLFAEVIIITLSLMACSVLTCFAQRGKYAKEWVDTSPEPKRRKREYPDDCPQGNIADNFPMEPEVHRKQPGNRLTYTATVHHHGADVDSSMEASGSSGFPESSSVSEKLPSADSAKNDPKVKEAKTPVLSDDDSKTGSSSPVARAYNFLFKRQ